MIYFHWFAFSLKNIFLSFSVFIFFCLIWCSLIFRRPDSKSKGKDKLRQKKAPIFFPLIFFQDENLIYFKLISNENRWTLLNSRVHSFVLLLLHPRTISSASRFCNISRWIARSLLFTRCMTLLLSFIPTCYKCVYDPALY